MEPADLAFAGLARQAELVRAREVSAREAVETSLRRIDRLDRRLHAFRVVLGERALAEADQAAARGSTAGDERPLLGVPVAIKDDVDVAGEVTAYGTRGPRRRPAARGRRGRPAPARGGGDRRRQDQRARADASSRSPSPPTFGVTRNPWDVDRPPGGSSGGVGRGRGRRARRRRRSGSDGAGSMRIPAACCGLFGLKPQRGRISLAPVPGALARPRPLRAVADPARARTPRASST